MTAAAHWTGLAALIAWLALELVVRSRSAHARDMSADGRDAGSTLVLVGAYVAAIVLPAIVPAGVTLPAVVLWIAVLLAWTGVGLRAWGMRTLGASYTRTLRTDDSLPLITAGPYRLLRHPGYTGSLATWAGYAFSRGALIPALVVTALLVAAYAWRITAEERMLAGRFGPEWKHYSARTWRLLPGLY
jgi:protein-S-isoprenylcysteine O-methyltransferase Ste14